METPGRFSGSKVTDPVESVTALLILVLIWSGVSVRLIRLRSEGSDLLIFCIGLRRLITRGTSATQREGAITSHAGHMICTTTYVTCWSQDLSKSHAGHMTCPASHVGHMIRNTSHAGHMICNTSHAGHMTCPGSHVGHMTCTPCDTPSRGCGS